MTVLRIIANPRAALARAHRRRQQRTLLNASVPTSLRRQFIRPVDQPMILVSQVQRSGGTLMGRLLDGHPACFTYPAELAIGGDDKSVWPNLAAISSVDAAFELMTRRSLNWTAKAIAEGYRKDGVATAQEPRTFVFHAADFRRVFDDCMARYPNPSARNYLDAYHTAFFNCWIDNQGFYLEDKKFVAAFTPRLNLRHENHERFWACYPDGYWLTIIRSPANWYASASRHSMVYSDPKEALAIWRASAESSLQLKRRYPARVILLHFEDLVTQTEACMREICRRTGLGWSPSLLVPSFNGMAVESNSSFLSGAGIDARAAKRELKDALTSEVQETILKMDDLLKDAEGDFDLH